MNKFLLIFLIALVSSQNLRGLESFNWSTFYTNLVKKHNALRKKHKSTALTKLADIAKLAQTTVNGCVKKGTLIHSGNSYKNQWLGQNLYVSGGVPTPDGVLKSWYTNEQVNYDYNKGESKNGGTIGHFTQVVWKNSKQIGCAYGTGTWSGYKNSYFICCNYFPGGNVKGAYTKNVAKPSS